jgi:uncharacterized membrane protein
MYESIRVQVTITSEFNTTTPVLDRLLVKWMDRRVWRDEFYGSGKVDRLLGLDVAGGELQPGALVGVGSQIIIPSIMGDDNYTTTPKTFFDAGGLDYLSRAPHEFPAKGTSAVDVSDVNGDGYMDVALAVHRTGNYAFGVKSPLYLGGPLGLLEQPSHRFSTIGAMDVLLRDLDDDGHTDVVFAQERRAPDDYVVNSTLFWGSADGWADTPDVEFATSGASDVEAVDLNDDGLLDLVFACYRGATSTVDSLVFMQNATGFNGSSPSHRLATMGARAVASGDLDGDSLVDLVVANSFSGGFTEIDSHIHWGRVGGGFETTTTGLPTKGASDVKVADLDGDTDLDIVFANYWDDSKAFDIYSAVYLNDGTGGFSSSPDVLLPTSGATGVAIADLDGIGWMDLVFSCERGADTYKVPSVVFLGGLSGWPSTPDIAIPTEGASDVMVARLYKHGSGGYMSVPIELDYPRRDAGTVHTLRYSATMGPSISGTLRLVDEKTLEVLMETPLKPGVNELDVQGAFKVREHPTIRAMGVLAGLESRETFSLDDLWLNWTKRVQAPPQVLDLGLSESSIYRTQSVDMWVNASDEYDLPGELTVVVQHRLNGTGTWEEFLFTTLTYNEASGSWETVLSPKVDAPLGMYDFRVTATDLDDQRSLILEAPNALEIMNNLPTSPVVHIGPVNPVSTSTLNVVFDTGATDIESSGLTYNFTWFRNGELVEELTGDSVPSYYTTKGENWSVEVRAFDGDELGPPAFAWRIIANAPPAPKDPLPNPEFDEDTTDQDWIDLSSAFEDEDGDALTWSVASQPEHLEVSIDPVTGRVTLIPEPDWFGEVEVTFIASDGELQASQTVTVRVVSVNDIPWIATVNGAPPASDPMSYSVNEGEVLTITYTVGDIEGDEVRASLNVTTVDLDEETGTITFDPGTGAVGTVRFALWVWDVVTTTKRSTLNFTIEVVNVNDPMEEPSITQPAAGAKFRANQSFSLVGVCDDPDVPFGQELEFIWSSDIEGELGQGSSIVISLSKEGTHTITLTVRDPEFQKQTSIQVVIEPREDVKPPPPPNGDGITLGTNWAKMLGIMVAAIIVVLVIIGAVVFVVIRRRAAERYEDEMEAEEAVSEEEERRRALERARVTVKRAADQLEVERGTVEISAKEGGVETEVLEEVDIASVSAPAATVSMEAKKTAAPSKEVEALFEEMEKEEPAISEEELEAMRLDNLKRKYQNAIGRLPYGIPSEGIKHMDWVELAAALATGEKKTLPDGIEITAIDGRWYYSDAEDSSTFLKEHGAKPKPAPKAQVDVTTDKKELLAKLEERFILGEISEETYRELKRKFAG